MLISTLTPIPKTQKQSVNFSENFRAIALSSTLGKVLDLIIMKHNSDIFKTTDYQFVLSRNTPQLCVLLLLLRYYLSYGSDVYLLLLDASKAFDKYVKLFQILNSKGLCPMVTSLLISTQNRCCVSSGEYMPEYCSGVK